MSKAPSIFIPHGGGPCFFMEWQPADTWDTMADFLRQVPATLDAKPDAIVLISGHWEEDIVTIQSNPSPPLLFDYYGFPESTYRLTYPAPGSTALAERIGALLAGNGISSRFDTERGFDHGAFIPLKLVFPEAELPVVQVSLRADLNPTFHVAVGAALEPLRDENVIILGSGMTYHNMQALMGAERAPGSAEFDDWLTRTLTDTNVAGRSSALADWQSAPFARVAHPREEHLLPLHVVVGAAGHDLGQRTYNDLVLGAVQSAFQFG